MEEKIFEGQYDHVLEEDYSLLLDEIIEQIHGKYENLHDDTFIKFRIKVEVLD